MNYEAIWVFLTIISFCGLFGFGINAPYHWNRLDYFSIWSFLPPLSFSECWRREERSDAATHRL